MLYTNTSDGRAQGWHVSDLISGEPRLIVSTSFILSIQADGDELAYINALMPGLAIHGQLVAHWYGDLARTIWLNTGGQAARRSRRNDL